MGKSITIPHCILQHFVALIKKLIQIHPPALRMMNNGGKIPFCLVFKKTTTMRPIYWEHFSRLIEVPILLPIHYCIQSGCENSIFLDFCQNTSRNNHDLVNVPTRNGLLPIHLAAYFSTVEVMQILYKYSPSSFNVMVPGYGSVANLAACNRKLDILKYINPQLILLANSNGRTPLYCAVASRRSDCDFIQAVYALGTCHLEGSILWYSSFYWSSLMTGGTKWIQWVA